MQEDSHSIKKQKYSTYKTINKMSTILCLLSNLTNLLLIINLNLCLMMTFCPRNATYRCTILSLTHQSRKFSWDSKIGTRSMLTASFQVNWLMWFYICKISLRMWFHWPTQSLIKIKFSYNLFLMRGAFKRQQLWAQILIHMSVHNLVTCQIMNSFAKLGWDKLD